MKQASENSVHYKLLVLLIVAASCVRVFVCFQHNPVDYLSSDMMRHWHNGAAFPRGGYFGASDPIGYQVYIWVLHHLTGDNRLLVAMASALLSVLMPWTYYRAARNFGLGKVPALWVWTLIAWTPSLLTIYHYIMMETLLLLLEGVALWMTARYLRKGGTGAFLLFVASWTLAALTKPTVIPLAAICFLWVWWKKSTSLKEIGMGTALAALLIAPQAIRSKAELGFMAPFGNPWLTRIMLRSGARVTFVHFYTHSDEKLHFRSHATDADMNFASPSALLQPMLPLSSWAPRRVYVDSQAHVIINSANGERDWKEACAGFNVDRAEWLAQWRENIVLFFFSPSWPDLSLPGWDGRLEYWGRWLWAPLIVFVFVCNIREFVRGRFELIPVAVTLFTLVMALQNAVLTEGRYRKPVEPVLLLNLVWAVGANAKRSQQAVSDQTLSSTEA